MAQAWGNSEFQQWGQVNAKERSQKTTEKRWHFNCALDKLQCASKTEGKEVEEVAWAKAQESRVSLGSGNVQRVGRGGTTGFITEKIVEQPTCSPCDTWLLVRITPTKDKSYRNKHTKAWIKAPCHVKQLQNLFICSLIISTCLSCQPNSIVNRLLGNSEWCRHRFYSV